MSEASAADVATDAPADAVARACARVAGLATGVAATALLGLVLVQAWQVFARYVLNDSPSWTEPVTVLLLMTAMGLGAAAGVHGQRHFGFFLLAQALPPSGRRIVDVLVNAVVVTIGAVLAGWGLVLLRDGFDIRMAGAPLPQSIVYLPLSLGGALMVLFAAERLWRALRPGTAAGVH